MSQRTRIARRTFLKGMSATMALPLLESMMPARALAAGTAAAPTRMAFVFFPNGAIMDSWKPAEAGALSALPTTLEPLADFKDDLLVVTGLAQDNGRAKGDGAGDHARSAASYLTGAHPYKTHGANIKVGISVDQVAAQFVGDQTKLPSLEIGIEGGRNAGNCDSGYSCAYSSNISWKTENTPMAKEINPRLVFERMFGSGADGGKESARRVAYRKSILDMVAADAGRLKQRLGQTDRRKMDEYFTSVREIEQRIERAEQITQKAKPDMEAPTGIPRDMQEHIRLMYDLMVCAFRTDSTRIVTFMLANEGSNRSYTVAGVKEGHHSLSHHQKNEEKIAELRKIDKFLVSEFAYFLKRMKEVQEGGESLLDHSMLVYGSGLSDGNAHWHHDLPIVMAGNANGTIATGRHLKFEDETPMNNLFLSMLDRMGADVESIGDSKGRLKGLEG